MSVACGVSSLSAPCYTKPSSTSPILTLPQKAMAQRSPVWLLCKASQSCQRRPRLEEVAVWYSRQGKDQVGRRSPEAGSIVSRRWVSFVDSMYSHPSQLTHVLEYPTKPPKCKKIQEAAILSTSSKTGNRHRRHAQLTI